MFTQAEKNFVKQTLAEHIGNPAKRAVHERRRNALLRLMFHREQGIPKEEAQAEFDAADAEFHRVLGEPPLPPAA